MQNPVLNPLDEWVVIFPLRRKVVGLFEQNHGVAETCGAATAASSASENGGHDRDLFVSKWPSSYSFHAVVLFVSMRFVVQRASATARDQRLSPVVSEFASLVQRERQHRSFPWCMDGQHADR